MSYGYVHSIETFGLVDGPGVRFVVFLSGCNMRCLYCHNPDTWRMNEGKKISSNEIIEKALRYKSYWGKDSGITISGGEPLLQIDFLIDLFKQAKQFNINTVIDTSGEPFNKEPLFMEKFNELMIYTDLILLDIKHINNEEHIKLTGKTNKNILQMAMYLSKINKPVWIRHVLVPGITDNDVYLNELSNFISTLNNVQKIEVLPYHNLAMIKYKQLGIEYKLNVNPLTKERIDNANKILKNIKGG